MKKFKDAFNGLLLGFKHKGIIIQFVLMVLAIIGGSIIKLDYYEWLAFVICIFMVLSSEFLNTSIEKIGDYLNNEYDDKIKVIKDLAAAGVLLACFGALVVCLFVLCRRLL